MPKVLVKKLHPDAVIPSLQTAGSAGADVSSVEYVDIRPGDSALIDLGFAVSVPKGYELQLRPRSGLALKHGITVLNTPGTIDSDYRGPMKALLINHGSTTFFVNKGDRIAQLVLNMLPSARYVEVEELDSTARGVEGFGSTGRK